MKQDSSFRDLLSLCSVAALTPALRLLPGCAAAEAGRGAWLSVLLALPAALLYARFLRRFQRLRLPGEGAEALCQRIAGRRSGAAFVRLLGLWLLFYAAFTLRAGGERLVTTVYAYADRRLFVFPLGLAAAWASSGSARRLGRMGALVLPLTLGAILLSLLFALPELRADNLLPLTGQDALPILRGSLPTLDAALLVLMLLFLLSGEAEGEIPFGPVARRTLSLGLLLSAMTAVTVGVFGHELCCRLTRPYFSLIRNLVFFRTLERIEALFVALWIFSDFLLTAALLRLAGRCLLPQLESRLTAALCGGAATLAGCLMAPDAAAYRFLSLRLVPGLNLGVTLLLIPGVFLLGKLRRRF